MQNVTLPLLLRHFFDRRWVAANANYPNPHPTTFLGAFAGCLLEGSEIVFLS